MGTTQKQVRQKSQKPTSQAKQKVAEATAPATTQSIIGQTPSTEPTREDPNELRRQIAFYSHVQKNAVIRQVRAEEVMSRKKAKTWDAAKKAKMVRRLMIAKQEQEQCAFALDQLNFRLQQISA